jgi:hypothetical protein
MMLMMQVDGVKELKAAIDGTKKKLPRELKIAVNATAKKTRTMMSREVRKELATKAKAVNKTINIVSRATEISLSSTVRLSKTKRIPLRDFGARQTRQGVSYKISKSKGRGMVPGAFQGPKPGVMNTKWRGRVFKRVGKSRLPIAQLFGPSPWGIFVKRQLRTPVVRDGNAELSKQIQRRVRFNLLKRQGLI